MVLPRSIEALPLHEDFNPTPHFPLRTIILKLEARAVHFQVWLESLQISGKQVDGGNPDLSRGDCRSPLGRILFRLCVDNSKCEKH